MTIRKPWRPANELSRILTTSLLQYVNDTVFPWPKDKRLDGKTVGHVFFGSYDSLSHWQAPQVRSALLQTASIGIDNINPEDLISCLYDKESIDNAAIDHQRLEGIMLLLDQGPRYLCNKGTNARYIYHYFDVLSGYIADHLVSSEATILSLDGWEATGLDADQAILRILMLLAPLVHSEELAHQSLHLRLTERLRVEYERLTQTSDPHRLTYEKDLHDIQLLGRLLDAGPPASEHVSVPDFVYWMMRYYTSHVAYIRYFGRSPFRNTAVGRDDANNEVQWLRDNGVRWSADDEAVRQVVRADVKARTWTPLKL